MQFYIGVTDGDWFRFLSQLNPDEVNFWRPSGKIFSATETGAPFLFKLKYPENKIAGGGFFIRSDKLPLSFAWDAFKEKNGAPDYHSLLRKINSLRKYPEPDPKIGCIILNQPFFFPPDKWIDAPPSWSGPIVAGKKYDDLSAEGAYIMSKVFQQLNKQETNLLSASDRIMGREYLIKARLGQGAFKILVTNAYNNNCAVTGEKAVPVLQAAHILPYSENGPNKVNNGVLLRSDLHILFDRGYMTFDSDYRVVVSKRIKEEFNNGKHYYALQGKSLFLPKDAADWPGKVYLDWHNNNIFK
jgi:putative restriction endonuclease